MSVANVQACILIGNYCGVESLAEMESLYFVAQIMRLHEPRPEDNEVQREVKLRTWWSMYMIDRWSSTGYDHTRQIPDVYGTRAMLPMDETQFANMKPGSQRLDITITRPGLWGHMVELASTFAKVQDLHRAHAHGYKSHIQAETRTHELAAELDSWAQRLPTTMMPTSENMRQYAQRGLGSAFVALHMGYFHYAGLLYFPFLDLQLEETPTQILFAERCRRCAAEFSDFLALSNEIDGCEVVYFIVAHMTIVSSAALLHVLLFGGEAELPPTRRRLEANFKMLVKLRTYWPAVGFLMERLFTFQRACMRSADPNTHKIDLWMISFLLDHALPIAEKEDISSDTHIGDRDRAATDALSLLRS
ncbi:hypothetical protein ACHAQA_002098 [Verticillium albo-atrum]